MKIVVLCGGLSPERDVSISSGTRIAKTLKQNGHQIVLVDMYFGLENWQGSLDDIFDNPPPLNDMLISEQEPDLEEIRSLRRIDTGSDFGDRVIEVCQMADIVFMGLHGQCGEDGKVQAAFDLLGIRYTGSGFLGSAVAMDKAQPAELEEIMKKYADVPSLMEELVSIAKQSEGGKVITDEWIQTTMQEMGIPEL